VVRNSARVVALTIGVMASFLVAQSTDARSDDLPLNIPAKQSVAGQTVEESSVKTETNPQKSMLISDSSPSSSTHAYKLQLADAATTVENGMTAGNGTTPANAPAGDAELEVPRDQTVRERPRPEVDALGVHVGGFYAFPSLRTSEIYDDNIFATPSHTDGDFITELAPELTLQSNWNNHALNFDAGAAAGFYATHSEQDYVDYHFGTDGRLDVTRDHQLTAAFSYRHQHEDRSSPDETQGKFPTEYDLYRTDIGSQNQYGRFSVNFDGQLNRYKYFNVEAEGGGTINNNDRDRFATVGSVTVSYEIVPDYEAYVRTSYNRQDYDDNVDNEGFNRNSQGFETVVGLGIDLGGVTRADVFAGYLAQFYESSDFDTVSGPSFGASLTWNVTGITTVTASLTRTLEETTTVGAAGYFATDAIVNIDHELLRNLILNAFGGYGNNDYEGISRNDNVWIAGAGVEYLMNRYMSLDAKYRYDTRDSSDSEEDYARNLILLSLNLKL
jgi:hypothetical protein